MLYMLSVHLLNFTSVFLCVKREVGMGGHKRDLSNCSMLNCLGLKHFSQMHKNSLVLSPYYLLFLKRSLFADMERAWQPT